MFCLGQSLCLQYAHGDVFFFFSLIIPKLLSCLCFASSGKKTRICFVHMLNGSVRTPFERIWSRHRFIPVAQFLRIQNDDFTRLNLSAALLLVLYVAAPKHAFLQLTHLLETLQNNKMLRNASKQKFWGVLQRVLHFCFWTIALCHNVQYRCSTLGTTKIHILGQHPHFGTTFEANICFHFWVAVRWQLKSSFLTTFEVNICFHFFLVPNIFVPHRCPYLARERFLGRTLVCARRFSEKLKTKARR